MAEEEDGAYMRLLLVVAVKNEDFTHPRALASNLAQPLGIKLCVVVGIIAQMIKNDVN